MGDHLSLCADRLITLDTLNAMQKVVENKRRSEREVGSSSDAVIDIDADSGSTNGWGLEPLVFSDDEGEMVECRICQEEDLPNQMEVPCACSGSLKFAHRRCIQQWCNEKRDTTCEICHQLYQPGYTAPPPIPHAEEMAVDIIDGWSVPESPGDEYPAELLVDSILDENDECGFASSTVASVCRSAAFIMMLILLLRDGFFMANPQEEEEIYANFSNYVIQIAIKSLLIDHGFHRFSYSALVEAGGLAASGVASMLESGHVRVLWSSEYHQNDRSFSMSSGHTIPLSKDAHRQMEV
ncbi:Protein of unknown function DUF3675 [Dillenia turbinata]|uniref:RING-CH-type domain-containing protein n=1 Tax=Dillenia turbinata TaxID=194707 RepID=A0AAN8YS36_9MAGN